VEFLDSGTPPGEEITFSWADVLLLFFSTSFQALFIFLWPFSFHFVSTTPYFSCVCVIVVGGWMIGCGCVFAWGKKVGGGMHTCNYQFFYVLLLLLLLLLLLVVVVVGLTGWDAEREVNGIVHVLALLLFLHMSLP
jgi:hypothetical protein